MREAEAMHTDNFALVHPGGGVWTKKYYLGGISEGTINYRRFEAVSDIDVMAEGNLAILRYRSIIDIAVQGETAGELDCWHLDCYQRESLDSPWCRCSGPKRRRSAASHNQSLVDGSLHLVGSNHYLEFVLVNNPSWII